MFRLRIGSGEDKARPIRRAEAILWGRVFVCYGLRGSLQIEANSGGRGKASPAKARRRQGFFGRSSWREVRQGFYNSNPIRRGCTPIQAGEQKRSHFFGWAARWELNGLFAIRYGLRGSLQNEANSGDRGKASPAKAQGRQGFCG